MRLVNNEVSIVLNEETFQPEIHLTVAVPVGPLCEDGKRLQVEVFYQRIGEQFVKLLPLSKAQLESLKIDL